MSKSFSENHCMLCPIACGVDRAVSAGVCNVGGSIGIGERNPYETAFVARAARHYYEEPPISGTRGSGAIFFSGCNMACVFCQNMDITTKIKGKPVDAEELSDIMLHLQQLNAHNINLVTPAPHIKLLLRAIPMAKSRGLSIPIVYNTNAYEKVETLKQLDGLIDIYLPDLKYFSGFVAKKYSAREDYFSFASKAILEMYRQCGTLVTDFEGIAMRGIIIRHLVLPGSLDETRAVLDFISENLPLDTHISLMSQYTPLDTLPPPLNRRLLKREYLRVVDYATGLGFTNLIGQELSSANFDFKPDFNCIFE